MVRRVVTATGSDGRSIIVSDGEPPRSRTSSIVPGSASALVWATTSPAAPGPDVTETLATILPGPGETIALVVSFPPDSVYADPGLDLVAEGAQAREIAPGLVDLFEADGMHTTVTVDYAVVLEGEIVLDLGDGEATTLHAGDVVIQNGTRHAWRNPGTSPAVMFFVLMGTREALASGWA